MTVLNGILNVLVYSPLVIMGLLAIYAIAYGIWHYKKTGNIPPSYDQAFSFMRFILLKILIPVKLLVQFLWWLLPVFPGYRKNLNYIPYGAWDKKNIARSGLLLSVTIFITITALIYKYGYPNSLVAYSKFINISLLVLGMSFFVYTFVSFNKKLMGGIDGEAFPTDGDLGDKNRWIYQRGGKVLFYSIGVGLALAILGILSYLVAKYGIFSVTGLTILLVLSVLAGLFLIYEMLKTNSTVAHMLKNNSFLNTLFYAIFIIPCLFTDTVKFLYNHLRHTPQVVYGVLLAEIIFVSLYIVFPILQKYLYTIMPPKDNKLIIIRRNIENTIKIINSMKSRIIEIKRTHPPQGKMIDERGWSNIISNNLNNPKNIEELRSFLINYGYTTRQMCQDNPIVKNKDNCAETIQIMIKSIQSKTHELVSLQSKLSDTKIHLEELESKKNRIADLQKAKVLLRKPVYLKNKKIIGNYSELSTDNFDIEYNYNYGVSAWFFIRAQPPSFGTAYNKYTSILNYGGKPNILYNSGKNSLQIRMNNGKNQKPIVYKIDKFPLQKWNNIVINYDGGILDIFMNSKLVASFPNTLPYMSIDQMSIGEDNGTGGGVCNVVYFPSIMSKERINLNYRILRHKNPPII